MNYYRRQININRRPYIQGAVVVVIVW
jgi:hypothetical protein